MSRLTRRLDNSVTEVRELLDLMMLAEREASLTANALNQVTWHIYELRRRMVKDLRARGLSWGEVGTSMGISRQSAHQQWHTVDGELLANIAAGYRPRADLVAEDRARAALRTPDAFQHVAGQLALPPAEQNNGPTAGGQ